MYNHKVREPELIDELSKRILGSLIKKYRPKWKKELQQRWGSNEVALANIYEGMQIKNEDGEHFWTLLFKALRAEHGDWRQASCDQIIVALKMESIEWGIIAEIETGHFFNEHILWHALPGELAIRPGFRVLELVFELLDKTYPYQQSLQPTDDGSDPPGYRDHFPLLMNLEDEWKQQIAAFDNDPHIARLRTELEATDDEDEKDITQHEIDLLVEFTQEEKKRLQDLLKLKREQLEVGVKKSRDEVAKLTEEFFHPKLIVLLLVHPLHGAGVLRAILERAEMGGLDLDKVWEEGDKQNEHLINMADVEWGHKEANFTRSGFEKAVFDKLEGREEEMKTVLRRYGLYQAKVRDEIKLFSRETAPVRSNESTHRLRDFWEYFPGVFDLLHSRAARAMSNTRPAEAAHGFQKKSWDNQRTFVRNDSQLHYYMKVVYIQRAWRRHLVLKSMKKSEVEDKAEYRAAPKHNNTKTLNEKAGEQTFELAERYHDWALIDRFPQSFRDENTIKRNNKKGMKFKNNDYAARRLRHSRDTQAKRTRHRLYAAPSDWEYNELARSQQPEHDRLWAGQDKTEKFNKSMVLLTKKCWEGVPQNMFMQELERVLPNFYEHVMKLDQSKQNRKHLLRSAKKGNADDKPTNCLVSYVGLVKQIVKGRAANKEIIQLARELLPLDRCQVLNTASKEDVVAELVKVDESEHLASVESNVEDRMDSMRDVIRENGCIYNNLDRFILPKKSFPKYTISYQHPEEGEEVGQETEYLAEDEANDDEVDGPPPAEDENANEVDDDDALYADVENAAELMAMGLPTSWMGVWALDDEEDEDEDQDDANEDQMNIDDDNDDEEEEEDGMVE